ncbi:hypothetical protein KDK95_25525 [Actinospica sp. MGRD01-02]|uniref:Uncharacterized protein n=1 Tax=Actinospica acidithermotolerans TaxID=2828514 RepID=A0A941IL67_9ACTN|nr:hypothetical protein [Actinospica acidithermotolerans]MBR7829692.1 hypothetical protein [Actinospica acidithermotolerans]
MVSAPDRPATLRRTLRASADRVTARLLRAPIEQRAMVARAVVDARAEPDATALIDSICTGPDDELLGAFAVFDMPYPESLWRPDDAASGTSAVEALLERLLTSSEERFEGLIARLFDAGLTGPAKRAATHLAMANPEQAMKLAAEFAREGRQLACQALLGVIARRAQPRTIVALLNKLERAARREIDAYFSDALIRRPDPDAVFDALRRDCGGEVAERFLAMVATEASAATLTALYEGLSRDRCVQ